jgi:hypothetical protein
MSPGRIPEEQYHTALKGLTLAIAANFLKIPKLQQRAGELRQQRNIVRRSVRRALGKRRWRERPFGEKKETFRSALTPIREEMRRIEKEVEETIAHAEEFCGLLETQIEDTAAAGHTSLAERYVERLTRIARIRAERINPLLQSLTLKGAHTPAEKKIHAFLVLWNTFRQTMERALQEGETLLPRFAGEMRTFRWNMKRLLVTHTSLVNTTVART